MLKKFLIIAAGTLLFCSSACAPDKVEYNSNSGYDGTRDSASQLLVDTNKVDDVDADAGDNEDWYFFVPKEEGFINVSVFFDSPNNIVGSITVFDGFGRTLNNFSINASQNIQDLPKIEVKADERYFVAIKITTGKSTYTIAANFELPPAPEVEPTIVTHSSSSASDNTAKTKCVPADKCKAGQKCCKPRQTTDDAIPEGAKTIKGNIVLVTPREGEITDIKINGLGTSKGVKPGMKAYLRGLNRKVDIYSCKTTSCQATVKATSEELARYDSVDVVLN